MAPQINTFLALSVGHRSDSPLPGPAETATQLRQKALEVLERWDERFGNLYAEVWTQDTILARMACHLQAAVAFRHDVIGILVG